jgi:hypothetical protein
MHCVLLILLPLPLLLLLLLLLQASAVLCSDGAARWLMLRHPYRSRLQAAASYSL